MLWEALPESRMSRLVRQYNWAATPLGPAAEWPAELSTTVSLVLESRFPAAIIWGPGLTTIYNDAFGPILGGKPEALGRSFEDVWAEVWDQIGPIADRALSGEATFIENFPLQILRSGRPEDAWFTFCYSPIRSADGVIGGFMDTVVETTGTVRARIDQTVLTHELRHRLKNTLAAVQALAWETLSGHADRSTVMALLDRIVAMGAAHDILFREGGTAATLEDIACGSLAARQARIDIHGPQVLIGARVAVALSLVLHELATNAVKYGALSTRTGRVTLSWHIDTAAGLLKVHWRETGGPVVSPPEQRGFGSWLIDRGVCDGGTVIRRYDPAGFEVDIEAPIDELMAE